MWSASPFGTGHLILLGESFVFNRKGELFLFETKPSGFEVDFRQQILGPGRAYFAYSKRSIFARDKRRLIRLDLIRNSENKSKFKGYSFLVNSGKDFDRFNSSPISCCNLINLGNNFNVIALPCFVWQYH